MACGNSSGVTNGNQVSLEQQEAERKAAENEAKLASDSHLPSQSSQIQHIFRNATGHLSDTPHNRKLICSVANDSKNYLGIDAIGKKWYAKTLSDGRQVWVSVLGKTITNAGINSMPRNFDAESGLNNNPKKNGTWRRKK